MKFTVIVSSCADARASQNALSFCHALIRKNQTLVTLFFLGDGVSNASRNSDISLEWQSFLSETGLNALCCSRSASDRLLTDERGQATKQLQEGFKVSGLGQLVVATQESDRIITFGQSNQNEERLEGQIDAC